MKGLRARGTEPSRARGSIPGALLPFLRLALGRVALLLLPFTSGCHNVPEGRVAVERVALEGIPSRSEDEIEAGLSTRPSSKFLGMFEGVYEYEVFDQAALDKDLERIERQLRRRGYYEAKVRAARVVRTDEDRVRVEIRVEPGEQVRIGKLETTGLAALPFDAARRATRSLSLRVGDPFDESEYEKAQLDLANSLADVGYAFVRVNGKARVDLSAQRAEIQLDVSPGKRAQYGEVLIEGLSEVPEGPVRDALQIVEGDTYSRGDLEIARTALFQLGVFSKVDIVPILDRPDSGVVPITVQVNESPLRNVTLGGGVKFDVQRLAVTGRASWTDRNFLGGLRKLTISTRPGLTFFPLRIDNIGNYGVERLLPENSLTARLEQPSFLEGRTRGFIESGFNVYPLLYPLPEGVNPADERIIGYNEGTQSVGVERNFFGRMIPVRLSMNWRANFPFTYQGSFAGVPGLEGGLKEVIVTYPELFTALDLRDNPIQPTSGFYLSNTAQVAVHGLGGMLSDVRIRPEARGFLALDYAKKLVLAARFTVGFVFPADYGSLVQDSANLNVNDPRLVEDQHKLLFRAFYSGGPDSNRGYPFQRIGPQGPISFLIPTGGCGVDPDACVRPLGGFSLWEASLELRWKLADPWGVVAFVDASDVSSKVGHLGFQAPHISVGPGLRYNSPVGPVRVDLGWRVPGLQKLGPEPGEAPDVSEVAPYASERWFEALALHILIGEAF